MKTSDLGNAKAVFPMVNPFFSLHYQLWKFDLNKIAAVLTAICAKKIGYAEIALISHFLFQNRLNLSGIVERYVDQSEMLAVGCRHIVDGIGLRPKPDGQTVVGGIHELMQWTQARIVPRFDLDGNL